MTTATYDAGAIDQGKRGRGFRNILRQTWNSMTYRNRQHRAANHLRSLSDQHLKDIGIHRSEITSVVYGRAGDRIRIHDVR